MGQQYTTRATETDPDPTITRAGDGEPTATPQSPNQETLAGPSPPEPDEPAPEELDQLQSAGTPPAERYQRHEAETKADTTGNDTVTPADSTDSPRSAAERARTNPVSEWRNEEVLEPTAAELRGETLDEETTATAPPQQTVGDAADFEFGIAEETTQANAELPDPPTVSDVSDPDGYAEKYAIVEQEELDPAANTSEPEGVREDRRPGLSPNPTGDPGQAAPEQSLPADGQDEAPTAGNLGYTEGATRGRDASRPTAFDVEYGFSAREGDVQWDDESGMSIAGGIPAGPDDASPRDFIDDDLWELPSTTVTEMEERFRITAKEPEYQHDSLKQRYGGTLDEKAGNAEVAKATAIREQVSSETPTTDEPHRDPESAWEHYSPETETREILGESVTVATEPAPPVHTPEYDYSHSRAQRVRQSLSDAAQQSLDEKTQQIAETVPHADTDDVQREYLKRLERNRGTINADDVDAVKLYLENNPGSFSTVTDTLEKTRNAFLTDSVATGSGYTQTYTTRGTLDVEDVPSVVSFHHENGYSDWRNDTEARADVKGTVDATVPRPQTRSGVDQVLYVSNPESGVDEQLKVTIWDSGINTDERAASNNAERDASGRKIEQTKNIPSAFAHGDEIVLKDAKVDTYGTDETPTAEIDSKANVTVNNRSGSPEREQVSSTERPISKNRYTEAPYWAHDQDLSKTVTSWERTGFSPSTGTEDGWKETIQSDTPPAVAEKTTQITSNKETTEAEVPSVEDLLPDDVEWQPDGSMGPDV